MTMCEHCGKKIIQVMGEWVHDDKLRLLACYPFTVAEPGNKKEDLKYAIDAYERQKKVFSDKGL